LVVQISKRGHAPLGGGEVTFRCPSVKALKPGFNFTSPGQILKIRGVAHSVRVSPQFSARLVSAARSVLNRYIPDLYIYTDQYRGDESGKSPGYALTLIANSTSTVVYSAEATSAMQEGENATPEDVGLEAARMLVEQIARGGCVDAGCETLVATMMTAGSDGDVVRCLMGGRPSAIMYVRSVHLAPTDFKTTGSSICGTSETSCGRLSK
jgi:RNA 3'-terminal phosphate cyclase-like protein